MNRPLFYAGIIVHPSEQAAMRPTRFSMPDPSRMPGICFPSPVFPQFHETVVNQACQFHSKTFAKGHNSIPQNRVFTSTRLHAEKTG